MAVLTGLCRTNIPIRLFPLHGTIVQQQIVPQQQNNTNSLAGTVPVQMAAPLNIPVTVQGIRISDTYSSFSTISNAIPYSITTYSITNISGLQQSQ